MKGSRDEIERIRSSYARREATGRDRRYTLFEPAHLFQTQSLERSLLAALRGNGLTTLAGRGILDVGCGGCGWLTGLVRYGAEPSRLIGVDLRDENLPRSSLGPRVAVASADLLPFGSGRFDLVCQLTMMSSVLDAGMRSRIAAEMLRVLRPGGFVLWYDFTVNPFNSDVAGIRPAELRGLFPGAVMRWHRVTLAPPAARLLAPHAWLVGEVLERVPWFRTHVLATLSKAEAGRPARVSS